VGKNIDSHKLSLHPEKVARWVAGKPIAPVYIEVGVTSACNHKCVFCAPDYIKRNKMINAGVLIQALNELSELGSGAYMVAGEGEPFMHKDILDILIQPSLDMSITTNGVLATPEMIQHFIAYAVWTRFSVDAGTAETYARLHGTRQHDFHTVIRNIESACSINNTIRNYGDNKSDIDVQFLVLRENINELPQFLDIMTNLNVSSIQIKPYSHNPKSNHPDLVQYTKADIIFIDELVSKYNDSRIVFRRQAMLAYMDNSKTEHCLAMPFFAYIDSLGDYYTCGSMIGDERFRAGNIYQDSIRDIVYGAKLKSIHEYARYELHTEQECRANCRLARMNEYLAVLNMPPRAKNFI
jgi:GTP 3',8-cyclase